MNLKKQPLILLFFLVLLFFSFGMGLKQENRFPIPIDNCNATVTDQALVVTKLSEVSVEGNTYIKSKHGRGLIYIDFKQIKSVQFTKNDKKNVNANINLINGEKIQGILKGNQFLYGHASFGKFKIKLKEINSIVFQSKKPSK